MIRVLFFGPVAERVGHKQLSAEFRPRLTVQALRDELARAHPDAFALVSMTALDGERVSDLSTVLADGAEVVFMSKFSGG